MPPPSSSPPCLRTLSSSLIVSLDVLYPRRAACAIPPVFSIASCPLSRESERWGRDEGPFADCQVTQERERQGTSTLRVMAPAFRAHQSPVPLCIAKDGSRSSSPLFELSSFRMPKGLFQMKRVHTVSYPFLFRLAHSSSSSSSSSVASHRLSPVVVWGTVRHLTTPPISSSSSWFFSWREARKRNLFLVLLSFPFLLWLAAILLLLVPSKSCLSPTLLSIRVQLEGTCRVLRCAVVGAQILLDYHIFSWKLRCLRLVKKYTTTSPTVVVSDDARDSPTSGMGTKERRAMVTTTEAAHHHHEEEEEDDSLQAQWDEVHTRCAKRLVALAEANGGLYVKTGQIFANMSHVLPLVYCRVLASLQDKVQPRPFDEVLAVLKADLGGTKAVESYLEYIDPVPLAAASLSQVHRARRRGLPHSSSPPSSAATTTMNASASSSASSVVLPPSPWESVFTRDVVIKIQYIDIAARFRGDMLAINSLLALAGWAYPGFNFSDIVRKLEDTVEAELDFRKEAANSIRMGRELWKRGFKDRVICPTVHPDIQSSRVLVLNYIKGVKINDKNAMQDLGISPQSALRLFFDAVGYQVFVNGFFHADPHAGNILVRPMVSCYSLSASSVEDDDEGKQQNTMAKRREQQETQPPPATTTTTTSMIERKKTHVSPQVVLLDFGLCSELPVATREALCRIWIAAVTRNDEALKKMTQYYQLQSAVPHHSSSSSSSSSPTNATVAIDGDGDGSQWESPYALFASCFLQYPYHLFPKQDKSLWQRFRWAVRGGDGGKGNDGEAAVRHVKKAIQRQIAEKMIEMQDIVTTLPKEFALVLRAFLATRAINQELGVPINRHRCFLAYALEGASASRASSSSEGCENESGMWAGWGDGGSGRERFFLYVKFYLSNMQNAVARFLLRFYTGGDLLDEVLFLG